MIALRLINLIAWAIVLAYMAPALVAIYRAKPRTGDPARLVCAGFAVLITGFNLRWLAIPESRAALAGLIAFSIVMAVFTIKVARTYGRGDHVQ